MREGKETVKRKGRGKGRGMRMGGGGRRKEEGGSRKDECHLSILDSVEQVTVKRSLDQLARPSLEEALRRPTRCADPCAVGPVLWVLCCGVCG